MLCYVGLLWAYTCLKDGSSEIGGLGKQAAANADGLDCSVGPKLSRDKTGKMKEARLGKRPPTLCLEGKIVYWGCFGNFGICSFTIHCISKVMEQIISKPQMHLSEEEKFLIQCSLLMNALAVVCRRVLLAFFVNLIWKRHLIL